MPIGFGYFFRNYNPLYGFSPLFNDIHLTAFNGQAHRWT